MIQSSPKTENSWWYTAVETPTEFEHTGYEAAVWGSDGDMVARVEGNLAQDESAELRANRIALLPDLLDALRDEFECRECDGSGTTCTNDRCKDCNATGWNVKGNWKLQDVLSEMELN